MKKSLSLLVIISLLGQFIIPFNTTTAETSWTIENATHLAQRALIGPTPEKIEELYLAGSATNAVNILFPSLDGPDRSNYENILQAFTTSTGFSLTNGDSMNKYYALKYFLDPYEAKAKLFMVFEDIFASGLDNGKKINYIDIENTHKLIYKYMFGSYNDLIKKIMFTNLEELGDYTEGAYLDFFNQTNKKSPNENYARELLQLFLMDEYKPNENKDLGSIRNYEETDVASFAKIIFGFKSDSNNIVSYISPTYTGSDIRNVEFLSGGLKSGDEGKISFYNSASGTINLEQIQSAGGLSLRNNIIDYIFSKRENEISLFVANKLIRFYVNENPTNEELNQFVNILKQNNLNIYTSIKWLLSSDMMYSDKSKNELRYKNPIELSIGTIKILNQNNPTYIDPVFYIRNDLLTTYSWTPYQQYSIFGRSGFDKNDNFYNSNLQNKWISTNPRYIYSYGVSTIDKSKYNIGDKISSAYNLLPSTTNTGGLTEDEVISTFEEKLLLGRKIDNNTKEELKNFLNIDENGNQILFNSLTQKEKIESIASIIVTLPEFVLSSGFNTTPINRGENSFLNNTNSKLVLVNLNGGYDYLNDFFSAKNKDYMSTIRPTLYKKDDEIVQTGDFYMSKDIAYSSGSMTNGLKSLYDSGYLRIFNRTGTKNHSRDHEQASRASASCDSFTVNDADGTIGKFLKQEPPTNTLVIGNSKPYILRNGNYTNIGGGGNIFNNERLSNTKKNQVLNTIRNIGNTKTFPGNTSFTFKDAVIIDTIGQVAKNSPLNRDGVGNGNTQNYEFVKTMMENSYGKIFYVNGDGGYDTHDKQAESLGKNINSVVSSMVGFFDKVKDTQDITIVLFSEFGRTIKENGSKGTDHGERGVMWVLTSNNKLKEILPKKIYGDLDITKEKEDFLGVGVYYDSVYAKIVEALYDKTGIYSNKLEDDLDTSVPKINFLNTELKSYYGNNNNFFTTIGFEIDSKNFSIDARSNVKIRYGTGLDSLKNTINNWELFYTQNSIVKSKKVKFTKNIYGPTFAYEITVQNNQYIQKVFTGVINTGLHSTGSLSIADNNDTFLQIFKNGKTISGEETLTDKILLGNVITNSGNTNSGSTSTGNTNTGVILPDYKILTKGNGIRLKIFSGSTVIDKLTGSGIWNGRFLLGEEIDKELTITSTGVKTEDKTYSKDNITKIVKIGADTLGVGLQLNKDVEIQLDGFTPNKKYNIAYSEDLLNWKNMGETTTSSSGEALFNTNHFTYFALIDIEPVITPPPTIPTLPPPPTNSNPVILSSGGGGGGGGITKDNCPNGDFSYSYYDKTCSSKTITSIVNVNTDNMTSKEIIKNDTIIQKEKLALLKQKAIEELKKYRWINYKGYTLLNIKTFNKSVKLNKIQRYIINSKKYNNFLKNTYINIINDYLKSYYVYLKNKNDFLNKTYFIKKQSNFILLIKELSKK